MKEKTRAQHGLTRFMRVFFYLLYQPLSWSYDLVAWLVSWGRWKNWVMTALPYLKGPRVLELGHGPGHLQGALFSKGIAVFGIDASFQMGKQAAHRLREENHTPRLARAYAQRIPFPDACFDQVVATFPTAYIYDQETLQEVYRILKTGGTLVVLPTVWITGKRLADRGTAALFKVTGQTPQVPSHEGWEAQWLAPFEKAGFKTEVEMITRKSWSLLIILAHKAI